MEITMKTIREIAESGLDTTYPFCGRVQIEVLGGFTYLLSVDDILCEQMFLVDGVLICDLGGEYLEFDGEQSLKDYLYSTFTYAPPLVACT
jgi:hypothetical protein